jgi:hypothetical protein
LVLGVFAVHLCLPSLEVDREGESKPLPIVRTERPPAAEIINPTNTVPGEEFLNSFATSRRRHRLDVTKVHLLPPIGDSWLSPFRCKRVRSRAAREFCRASASVACQIGSRLVGIQNTRQLEKIKKNLVCEIGMPPATVVHFLKLNTKNKAKLRFGNRWRIRQINLGFPR